MSENNSIYTDFLTKMELLEARNKPMSTGFFLSAISGADVKTFLRLKRAANDAINNHTKNRCGETKFGLDIKVSAFTHFKAYLRVAYHVPETVVSMHINTNLGVLEDDSVTWWKVNKGDYIDYEADQNTAALFMEIKELEELILSLREDAIPRSN
jgi:hypothetical protein